MSFGEVLMEVQEVVASRVIAGGHFDGHFRGPFGALVRDVFSEVLLWVFRSGGVRKDVLFVRLIRGKFKGPITL